MATKRPLDRTKPSSNVGGRPPALKPEHIAVLHDIVTERAQASLQEIADELHHRSGIRVCDATIRRALRAQGIVRLKPLRRACAARAEGAKRYGYTAAHRREDVEPYSTNLTDAEWELVADLFERVPGPPTATSAPKQSWAAGIGTAALSSCANMAARPTPPFAPNCVPTVEPRLASSRSSWSASAPSKARTYCCVVSNYSWTSRRTTVTLSSGC